MGRRTTVQLKTVPRPLDFAHSQLHEPHAAHVSLGTCRHVPQLVQRWKRSSFCLQCS
jgi:hypothetical protein